jgi:hypothetical protein
MGGASPTKSGKRSPWNAEWIPPPRQGRRQPSQHVPLVMLASAAYVSNPLRNHGNSAQHRSGGAEECSHGWSEPDEVGQAQPMDSRTHHPRPGRGGGGSLEHIPFVVLDPVRIEQPDQL